MKHLMLAIGLALAAAPLPVAPIPSASAAETKAFTTAAFEAAKKTGHPVLVEVSAPWCTVCKAQKPVLARLLSQPKFAKATVLVVDFDSQKPALQLLGVRQQSTLISYRGGIEVARSTGVVDPAAIEAQLDRSI